MKLKYTLSSVIYLITFFALSAAMQIARANSADPAPSAELLYKIKSSQKGIPVSGDAKINWKVSEISSGKRTYQLKSETSVSLFGKILVTSSKGNIDEQGLTPDLFTEKRFRRDQTQTSFDRQKQQILFSGGEASIAIKGGEQDRLSVTWQIVALAREAGSKLSIGQEWKMMVAGVHDADLWLFKVREKMTLRTEIGEVDVIHVLRAPPADAPGQQLELWLAPAFEYYPVRISFVDANGDRIEQKISKIQTN